jgi:hypothetical protein
MLRQAQHDSGEAQHDKDFRQDLQHEQDFKPVNHVNPV